MNNTQRICALLIGAASLACMGTALADARTEAYDAPDDIHVGIDVYGDDHITVDDGDVVITARDGSKARISPEGDLTIGGAPVKVDATQRQLLRRYALGIHDIERRGMQIGRDALDMVGGIMGTVVADLFSGDTDDREVDRDARAKAEPLKREARALCDDVRSERKLQSDLVDRLPAFKPYAVIKPESGDDCHVNDNDVEV